ncbi:AAA domain-containing protein, partial [bacterium]|nr:AAA domain-containing protein [bacterium]
QLFRKAGKFTRARPARGAKREMRDEAKRLKQDARRMEKHAIEQVLDESKVVCATITFDEDMLGDRHFDLVVIDEACQSTEPGCWIPIKRGERLVLAGDHCQLPPTVLSKKAAGEGFAVSMMERLVKEHGDGISRRLDVQYRMNTDIMQFSSEQFYDGGLIADDSVATHLLKDLPTVDENLLTQTPVTFIDSAGAGWDENLEENGLSKMNPFEATLIVKKATELIEAGLRPADIAVIAPYAAQVRLIRDQCRFRDLEIDTVDGFQGREKEAVLISLVRSNAEGEIGFLADARRMNVALTRARRKLIVIGDSATMSFSPFFADMFKWFETIGAYGTVWEEES